MRPCVYKDHRLVERCTECGVTLDLCLCREPAEAAARRLGSDSGRFLAQVLQQVFKAEDDGTPNTDLAALLQIQAADALEHLLRANRSSQIVSDAGGSSMPNVRQALIEVAALATRLATQGDPLYAYDPQE